MIGVSLKMAKSKGEYIGGELYEKLANAIILQAVKDWRTAYRACRRSYRDTVSRNHMYECESFFRSNWFKTLTNGNIDGRKFVQALKEQEDERWNKLHKQT